MIRHHIIIILVFLSLVSTLPLVAQDSLVHFNSIRYTSEFEKKAFQSWFKGHKPEALLDLFLSTDLVPGSIDRNARERIDQLVQKFASDPSASKKPEKYVKTIIDQVQRNFLKRYEMISLFPEIFRTGNYNSVNATALYALLFERLHIPYAIREKPTNVYLVAYPDQSNIQVETTSPYFLYMKFDDRYRQNFVETMVSQKRISDIEFQNLSVEELFNKYYLQDSGLTLAGLAGLHYTYDAIFHNDQHDYAKALEQVDKGYLLNPSPRTRYAMMTIVVNVLINEKPKPLDKAAYIARAAHFSKEGIPADIIKGEFAALTEIVLARDNNKPLYRQCMETIYNSIVDPTLKNEIAYYYYFELGRQQYNLGSHSQAKYYFAKAMGFQPNNAELGQIFTSSLGQTLSNVRDSQLVIDTLTSYLERYPNLKDNNNFQSMLAISYLMGMKSAMDKGNPSKAESYEAKFEAMYKTNSDLNVPQDGIGAAYSAGATYYFKKGMKSKARAFLDRGLKLAPDNLELRRRKQMIN